MPGVQIVVLETVNDPGTPGRTGDDRFGFDEAAGTAWALDGATDVTHLRPFPDAESGAAWIAAALSARLMAPPALGEMPEAYFAKVLTDVRARAQASTRIPLDDLPGEARPIASGMWMQVVNERAVFAWLGDCMALLRRAARVTVIGSPGKAEDETVTARRLLAVSPEERLAQLQTDRRRSNANRTCFGLDPHAAANLETQAVVLAPGDTICLMSDGLYRLIAPYGTHTPERFMDLVADTGLSGAVAVLRAFEDAPGRDMNRIKARDDACGVLLRIDATG
jgi:serine/threonine protein phosphatase PrpC